MKISCYPYRVEFREPFRIALGVRTGTDSVMVEIEQGGYTGYGEATLPPYLDDKPEHVMQAINDFAHFLTPLRDSDTARIFLRADQNLPLPAKAAIDEALWDLEGKQKQKTVKELLGIGNSISNTCTYTIGIDTPDEVKRKVLNVPFGFWLKLKLGSPDDIACLEAVREVYNGSLCIDLNQSWTDKRMAMEMLGRIEEFEPEFIEQPCPKDDLLLLSMISHSTDIPVIADESVQGPVDIERVADFCDGINIKLIKCGGISPAYEMIERARELGLLVLLGCMSETSCGIAAAAQLAPLCDWIDLDGPILISNDPFEGLSYNSGIITLDDAPGLGIRKRGLV